MNIIEKTTGSKTDTDLDKFCDVDIHFAISKIKDTNANHPSITEIKKTTKKETASSFKEIFKLLKNIDAKKSTGEDK